MDKPLHILILEDNPHDVEIMEYELRNAGITFESRQVMTREAFVRGIEEFCPDVILSDYDLPRYNGALALEKARKKCPDVPFILVTGAIGELRAIEILTGGATDYVLKNRLERLVPAVQRALAEAEEHKGRKKAEEELRKLNLLYSALYKSNDAILHIRDLDLLYPAICRIAVEEGMFRMAWIGLVSGTYSLHVKPVAWHGVEDGYLRKVKIGIDDKTDEGTGPTGTAVRDGVFNICHDWNNDPRMNPWREEGKKRNYRSSGAFPLRKRDRVIGALTLYSDVPHFFTKDVVSLLESMADNLSFAIQTEEQERFRKKAEEDLQTAHRKLHEMASEMIRSEERERQHIATVLHDTVAQTLAAAKMKCEFVTGYLSPEGLPIMDEARDLVIHSIRQTRSIMAGLSPPILYELGFLPALEWLTEQFTDQHHIPVGFIVEEDIPPLSHDIEVLLYQATRELLMNISKHAKAGRAAVTVSGKEGSMRITVSDDGIGLDKSKMGYQGDLSSGFGLFSIRERLKHFGGRFEIRSQKGKGTWITMMTPRQEEAV